MPLRPVQPALAVLTMVVGDAYIHFSSDDHQGNAMTTVVDEAVRRWVGDTAAVLAGRARLTVRVADMVHGTLWLDAMQTAASGAQAEQPMYLASHGTLWYLRAGGLLADLRQYVAQDRSLRAGLHPDAISCLRWAGALAGLPVALWPLLLATDARLPTPAPDWTWSAMAPLPAGAGWPVQLLPGAPPLETWLWPAQADAVSADGAQPLVGSSSAIAALHRYAAAFGPPGGGSLSPLPAGGLASGEVPAFQAPLTNQTATAVAAWAQRAGTLARHQVRTRQVGAWFPDDEWPPLRPGPHAGDDAISALRRPAPPGASRFGVATLAYGLGLRRDAALPDLLYVAARALQDTAPASLAYSPFTRDQGAAALRQRWSQLDAGVAGDIAAALRWRLRPVWGVPSVQGAPAWRYGRPSDITDPPRYSSTAALPPRFGTVPGATSLSKGGIYPESSAVLGKVLTSLGQVVALGIMPIEVAAANAGRFLQLILNEWTYPP